MALAEQAQLAVRIDLEGNASSGIRKLQGQVNGLGSSLGRVGKGVGQVGAGVAKAGVKIAAAVGVGLVGAAKVAIDFQDAFQGVVKTVDEADLASAGLTFDDLARALRDMATEMPIAATELAGIAEQAGALGIKGGDIESFTKTVALLGVTTDVATEDAATALGQLSNVLGLTGQDYDNFGAALVDLGNKGASTESEILEITRRAGGAAKLIELAADKTLGWSSAVANLGIQPELAGTSLQRFFLRALDLVSSGGPPLEKLAAIAGSTAKEFKKAFEQDASGSLETFLAGLGKLPKDERLASVTALFGKGTGLTRTILGLADSYEKNLAPSLDTATEAWQDNTALTTEAQRRFDTIRSKLLILKNGFIEAGITIGEGFLPALGRTAEKLSAFLAIDANKSALKEIGEDIGAAIDDIDWGEVLDGAREFVGVMKGALGFAKDIFDVINKLPTEVKAAGAGLIGLDKLSGGLIGTGLGNIIGGIAGVVTRSLGSKLPGVGSLFAQPVFVTNWPIGFGAGGVGGGVGKAAGGLGTALGGGAAVGVAALAASAAVVAGSLIATQKLLIEPKLQEQAGANIGGTQNLIGSGDSAALRQSIDGLKEMPSKLNPLQQVLYNLNANGVKTHTESLVAAMEEALQSQGTGGMSPDERQDLNDRRKQHASTERIGDLTVESKNILSRRLGEVKAQDARGARENVAAERRGSASVVSAIDRIPAPIVNVSVTGNSVTTATTKNGRYGKSNPSRNEDGGNPYLPGGR